jgi:hypothetical protein
MRLRTILLVAFLLLLAGAVLPFLMMMHVIESTLFLNFLAYALSTLGIFLGTIGIALNMARRKG